MDNKAALRKKALTYKAKLSANDTAFDERYWSQFSPSQRMEMTWGLFVDGCTWLGIDGSKLRLKDLLQALNDAKAKYVVVGGVALAYHAKPRFTRDLDIWVEASAANAPRVYNALANFGAPLDNLTQDELAQPDLVFQIGIAPLRVDIMTSITGVDFDEAWREREAGSYASVPVFIIGRAQLIKNKRATGRLQDLADIEQLERWKPDNLLDTE